VIGFNFEIDYVRIDDGLHGYTLLFCRFRRHNGGAASGE